MKRLTMVLTALALLLGGVGQANAALLEHFSITYQDGLGNKAFGEVCAKALGGGIFHAVEGTLTVTAGAATGTYTLQPAGPGVQLSASGAFIVDNDLYPGSAVFVDHPGPIFEKGSIEINLFGTAGDSATNPGSNSGYSFFAHNGSGYFVAVDGTASDLVTLRDNGVCPEPASLTLLGLGIAGLAGYGWRKRKQAVTA